MSDSLKGYDISLVDDVWVFCDTGLPVYESHRFNVCGHCGKAYTEDGHDGCIGELPGLMNACCGHGVVAEAYVQFLDGKIISGASAKTIMAEMQKGYAVCEG